MADLPTQKNRLFARTYTEMNGGLDDSQEATTGKIGGKLWAIFDPAEDNNLSQRRNANGGVITFPHPATRSRLSQRTGGSGTGTVNSPFGTNPA
jgi:hypothetical protein